MLLPFVAPLACHGKGCTLKERHTQREFQGPQASCSCFSVGGRGWRVAEPRFLLFLLQMQKYEGLVVVSLTPDLVDQSGGHTIPFGKRR